MTDEGILQHMQAAEEEEAAEAAADVVIRLGLAAFAVSAYIKTVLCPAMSSYTPRMSSASLVLPRQRLPCLSSALSGVSAVVYSSCIQWGARQQKSSALLFMAINFLRLGCRPMQAADLACSGAAGGTPRMMSNPQLGTPTTSLDKLQRDDMLMHELDQVTHGLHNLAVAC